MKEIEEYCAIIITPDSVRQNLEDAIVDDITKNTNIEIIWKKYLVISQKTVRFLYPRKIDKAYFISMANNMTSGRSQILVVRGKCGTVEEIKKFKGRFYVRKDGILEVDGIRLKYGARIVKYNNSESTKEPDVYEFRMHASDSFEETATICALFLSEAEIEILKSLAQSLYFKIQEVLESNPNLKKVSQF